MIRTPRRAGASLIGLLGVGLLLVAFGAFDARSADAVGPTPSITTLRSNANPSVYGQSLTLTAVVVATPPATGTPTGQVKFFDGATLLSTKNLVAGSVSYTRTYPVATHTFTAAYNGDVVFAVSTSAVLNQVVQPTPTATVVVSSMNPSNLGVTPTFTATVQATPPGSGAPSSGTVKFYDGGVLLVSRTPAIGIATFKPANLTLGTHSITAVFSGSASYLASTSAPLIQTVNAAVTTTTLTSNPNPSSLGGSVTLAAAVSSVAGTPTGTVSFSEGAIALGTATLTSGQATITAPALAVGTHPITATYSGAASYLASASAPLDQVVNRAATTTTIDSSANPSTYGQAITLTATITGGNGTPTGIVTFFAGATPLGTGSLTNGQASLSVSTLSAGSLSITGTYGGDANNSPSTNAPITQVVNPAASTTSITVGPNPGALGQPITLTATVTSPSGPPTGTVTYREGVTVLGTSTLTSGTTSISLTTLGVGTHSLSASFGGNPNVTGSFSAAVTETIVATTIYVDKANTSCKNTGTGAGLPATPYCAINSAAAKVVAGQTVQVAAGVYSERVTVAVGGSQAQPITFAPAAGASVAITGVVNGFTVSGKSWVTIRGFGIDHTGGAGISIANSSNITIDGNHITYAGQPVNGSTAPGIKINGSTNSTVINNVTDHNSDAGILITANADNNVIAHNESFANARGYVRAAAGIDLRNSTGEVVFDNILHDNEDSGINVWTGLADGSSTVYDNVVYSNGDHGIDIHNSVDAHIVANTVYNNSDSGIEMTTSVRATLNNNVSVDNGINSPRTAGNVRADVSSVSRGCVIQDDLVFLRTPGIMFDWNGVKYSSLAALQSATGMESRGIQADPRFTSAAGGNFRLLPGSPAIDSANTGATGQPSVDFDGRSRFDDPATLNTGIGPMDFADRGAFEYRL